jgi:hypothetical protein
MLTPCLANNLAISNLLEFIASIKASTPTLFSGLIIMPGVIWDNAFLSNKLGS